MFAFLCLTLLLFFNNKDIIVAHREERKGQYPGIQLHMSSINKFRTNPNLAFGCMYYANAIVNKLGHITKDTHNFENKNIGKNIT